MWFVALACCGIVFAACSRSCNRSVPSSGFGACFRQSSCSQELGVRTVESERIRCATRSEVCWPATCYAGDIPHAAARTPTRLHSSSPRAALRAIPAAVYHRTGTWSGDFAAGAPRQQHNSQAFRWLPWSCAAGDPTDTQHHLVYACRKLSTCLWPFCRRTQQRCGARRHQVLPAAGAANARAEIRSYHFDNCKR